MVIWNGPAGTISSWAGEMKSTTGSRGLRPVEPSNTSNTHYRLLLQRASVRTAHDGNAPCFSTNNLNPYAGTHSPFESNAPAVERVYVSLVFITLTITSPAHIPSNQCKYTVMHFLPHDQAMSDTTCLKSTCNRDVMAHLYLNSSP